MNVVCYVLLTFSYQVMKRSIVILEEKKLNLFLADDIRFLILLVLGEVNNHSTKRKSLNY